MYFFMHKQIINVVLTGMRMQAQQLYILCVNTSMFRIVQAKGLFMFVIFLMVIQKVVE